MVCTDCGAKNSGIGRYCTGCGKALSISLPKVASGFAFLDVPANSPAVWSYYLGLAAPFCLLTALPAVIAGIIGLTRVRFQPEAGGRKQAREGIILGGLGLGEILILMVWSL